jgi:hypothetical protein
MTKVTYYVATDGKQFETKEECLEYENHYSDLIKAMTAISKFCTHMSLEKKSCQNCPFYRNSTDECIVNDYAVNSWIDVF